MVQENCVRNAFLESNKGFERKALGISANLESIIADCRFLRAILAPEHLERSKKSCFARLSQTEEYFGSCGS